MNNSNNNGDSSIWKTPIVSKHASFFYFQTGQLPGCTELFIGGHDSAFCISPLQCVSVANVFALVGKKTLSGADLTSSELVGFSAGLLFYLTDPAGACQATRAGLWVDKARAFQTRFSTGNPASGPTKEKVAELLGAVQQNAKESEKEAEVTILGNIALHVKIRCLLGAQGLHEELGKVPPFFSGP